MKKLVLALAVGALFLSFGLAAPARAALSFEDPQVCLNGKLLMVEPTTAAIDVWLKVGPDVTVDLNVANCGGDPNLPILDASHIKYNGNSNWVEVAVRTKKFTDVQFDWNGKTTIRNSGHDNWVKVRTRVN